jgi:hypothetical protein
LKYDKYIQNRIIPMSKTHNDIIGLLETAAVKLKNNNIKEKDLKSENEEKDKDKENNINPNKEKEN